MKGFVTVLLLGCALFATACEEKKPEPAKPAATAAAKSTAKPTKAPATAAPASTGGGGW